MPQASNASATGSHVVGGRGVALRPGEAVLEKWVDAREQVEGFWNCEDANGRAVGIEFAAGN
jgi:hypothetical protein